LRADRHDIEGYVVGVLLAPQTASCGSWRRVDTKRLIAHLLCLRIDLHDIDGDVLPASGVVQGSTALR
jgi:hypothetical protein